MMVLCISSYRNVKIKNLSLGNRRRASIAQALIGKPAFVILDEAQNSTPFQMKMFLTRLGFDSKTVITGDITQSDLPKGNPIGLVEAQKILQGIEGIKFVNLTGDDVVRHELVQRIIEAYEKAEKSQ